MRMVTTLAIPSRSRKPLHKCRGSHYVPDDPFIANLDISVIKEDESITNLVLYADTLLKKEMRHTLMDLFAIPRPWKVEIRFFSPFDFLVEHEDRRKQAFALLQHVQYYEMFCPGSGQMPPRLMRAIIRSLPVSEAFQEYSFGDVALLPDQLLRLQEHVGIESVKHATLQMPQASDSMFTLESLVHLQSLKIPKWGSSLVDAMALIQVLQTLPHLEELETVIPVVNDIHETDLLAGFSAWLERPDCPLVRLKLNQGSGALSFDSAVRNHMLKGLGSNQRLKELAIEVNGDASVIHDDTYFIDDIIAISSIQRLEYSCSGSASINVARTFLEFLLLPNMETRYFTARLDTKVSSPEFAIVAEMIQQASNIHRMQEIIRQYFAGGYETDEIPLSLWPEVFEWLNCAIAIYMEDNFLASVYTSKFAITSHQSGMRRLSLSAIYQTLQFLTGSTCWGNGH